MEAACYGGRIRAFLFCAVDCTVPGVNGVAGAAGAILAADMRGSTGYNEAVRQNSYGFIVHEINGTRCGRGAMAAYYAEIWCQFGVFGDCLANFGVFYQLSLKIGPMDRRMLINDTIFINLPVPGVGEAVFCGQDAEDPVVLMRPTFFGRCSLRNVGASFITMWDARYDTLLTLVGSIEKPIYLMGQQIVEFAASVPRFISWDCSILPVTQVLGMTYPMEIHTLIVESAVVQDLVTMDGTDGLVGTEEVGAESKAFERTGDLDKSSALAVEPSPRPAPDPTATIFIPPVSSPIPEGGGGDGPEPQPLPECVCPTSAPAGEKSWGLILGLGFGGLFILLAASVVLFIVCRRDEGTSSEIADQARDVERQVQVFGQTTSAAEIGNMVTQTNPICSLDGSVDEVDLPESREYGMVLE